MGWQTRGMLPGMKAVFFPLCECIMNVCVRVCVRVCVCVCVCVCVLRWPRLLVGGYGRLAGAVAVFLAWMNLLIYIRRVGALGIYVLMLTDTLSTAVKVKRRWPTHRRRFPSCWLIPCSFASAQVLSVFSIFVVAFALAFYIMLQTQEPFETPGVWLGFGRPWAWAFHYVLILSLSLVLFGGGG